MAPSTCPCPPHQPAPLGAQPALQHPPAETIPQLQHPPAQPVSQLQHPLAQASTTSSPPPTCCANHAASCGVLQAIYLYPIKSCAPQQSLTYVPSSPLRLSMSVVPRDDNLMNGVNGAITKSIFLDQMAIICELLDKNISCPIKSFAPEQISWKASAAVLAHAHIEDKPLSNTSIFMCLNLAVARLKNHRPESAVLLLHWNMQSSGRGQVQVLVQCLEAQHRGFKGHGNNEGLQSHGKRGTKQRSQKQRRPP
eukprot:scaffold65555_cov36-Tisochrysis_lutea.AAC.1